MGCPNQICHYDECFCPRYGWVITHDFLENERYEIFKQPHGPNDWPWSDSHDLAEWAEDTRTFRLVGPDGAIRFYGVIASAQGLEDYFDGSEPLDQFGRHCGCTEIHYLTKDFYPQWERL